ncbi:MAG: hypothetical protein LBC76_04840 [Treponema sp.]|nr:hypothetical protein [Treponema sp.]
MKLYKTMSRLLYNKQVHALIALYMTMVILITFVFLLQKLLLDLITFNFIYPVLSGGISALIASFYCDIMKNSKSANIAADFCIGIIIILASYILSSLLLTDSGSVLKKIFLPNIHNISALLGSFYAWNSVISLKKLFGARRKIDEYSKLYSGNQLKDALFEDSGFLRFNENEIIMTRNSYLMQLTLIGLLLLLNATLRISLSLLQYFLLIIILESAVCLLGFLGIFRQEQYYAGEGMTLPQFDLTRRMLGIGIISALCITFAILWSSDKNIISFSKIIDFFIRLFEFFRRPFPQKTELELPKIELQPVVEQFIPVASSEEKRKSFPVWAALQYTLSILAAAVLIMSIISPLLGSLKEKKKPVLRKKLKLVFMEWSKWILSALTSLISFIKRDEKIEKLHMPEAEEINRTAENILGAYSHAKRQSMRKSANLFARLIIWGGEVRQITWKPSLAPGEYCSILAVSTPVVLPVSDNKTQSTQYNLQFLKRQSDGIIRCGELFEKALYSKYVLSDEERKEFKALVEEIISSGN